MSFKRILPFIVFTAILVFPVISVFAQGGEGLPVCPSGFIFVPSEYIGEGECLPVAFLPDGSLPFHLSVGGVTVSQCQLYLTPDLPTTIALYAGYSLRVTGINRAGTFYQIIPFERFPIRFWMPVECIAPNSEQYWFERPLPTNIVS